MYSFSVLLVLIGEDEVPVLPAMMECHTTVEEWLSKTRSSKNVRQTAVRHN